MDNNNEELLETAIKTTSSLIDFTNHLMCYEMVSNQNCIRRLKLEYFRPMTAKEYNSCCPSCSAFWHLQMARNALVAFARTS